MEVLLTFSYTAGIVSHSQDWRPDVILVAMNNLVRDTIIDPLFEFLIRLLVR
jgi:hypothetical protein